MSLLDIAKMFGLPPEIADALPELAAAAPQLIADAKKLLETSGKVVIATEAKFAQLDRIERKLDILGQAVIKLLEERENGTRHQPEPAPDALSGNHSGNAAALVVASNGNGE